MRELREATKARNWHSGGDNGRHGGNNARNRWRRSSGT